jgi:hypothetical protein
MFVGYFNIANAHKEHHFSSDVTQEGTGMMVYGERVENIGIYKENSYWIFNTPSESLEFNRFI